MSEKIVAFMFPSDSGDNAYIPQLRRAVEAHGVVVRDQPRNFCEAWLHENRGPGQVLHFHWPEFQYNHVDRAQMIERLRVWESMLRVARQLRYGVVWTAHNLYPHENIHPDLNHQGRLITSQQATGIIAHCQYAADAVERHLQPSTRPQRIPHGHYIDAYPPPQDRADARAKLGLRTDSFVMLSVGRLRWYKGIEKLFAEFRTWANDDVELLVAGHPRDEGVVQQLQAIAAEDARVHLHLGFVPNSELGTFFAATDCVVLPYTTVTTSGSLHLAMSMGVGTIAPRLGCIAETVTADVGLLYDADDSHGLGQALRSAPALDWREKGRQARLAARRQDWAQIGAATAQLYATAARQAALTHAMTSSS